MNKIKKIILLLAVLATPVLAEVNQAIGPFGGLDTNDANEAVPANQSPDMLNVNINPGGKSVLKREGYSLDTTFTFSTSPVHGAYSFYDASGNQVRLWGQDNRIWASVAGGTYVAVSTMTLGSTIQCTDYLGFAYCVTSNRDTPVKTNGTTAGTTFQGSIPNGTIIASTPERLLVAGVAAQPQRFYYSGASNFTDFTLGSQASSSSYEDITAPGSQLTHIAFRYGRWLWWKDQSFGFMAGTNQFDLQLVTVSDTIGTFDNTDVYDSGLVYFRGTDSHFYIYDGSVLTRISKDITPTVTQANRRKSSSWQISTQSDFDTGSYSSSTYFTGLSGVGIVNNSNTPDNSFENDLWTKTFDGSSNGWVRGTYPIVASGGCGQNSGPAGAGSWYMAYQKIGGGVDVSTMTIAVVDANSFTVLASTTVYFDQTNGCSFSSRTISGISGYAKTYGRILMSTSTTGYRVYSPGFAISGSTITFFSRTHTGASNSFYEFDLFKGGQTDINEGVYFSAVHNAPALTSWSSFAATDATTMTSTVTYSVRSSTNPFTILSSTPSWTLQPKNANVAVSTGTYFQLKAQFVTTFSSEPLRTQNFTFNWFEGQAADKMYGTYFDYAIWFAVSIGSSTSANNRILRWDLLNQTWTYYSMPVNGFQTYNNSLYLGDSGVGKTYKFGGVSSDNNAAINAYWKTKAFFGDSPFNEKELRKISFFCKSSSGTQLTVTYTRDLSSATSYTVNLYDPNKTTVINNRVLPAGQVASLFDVQFGDNSTNNGFQCFAANVAFEPKPWRVYP